MSYTYYEEETLVTEAWSSDLYGSEIDEQAAFYRDWVAQYGSSDSYCIQCIEIDYGAEYDNATYDTCLLFNSSSSLIDAPNISVNSTTFAFSAEIVGGEADMAIKLFSATGAVAVATGI